MEKTFVYVVTIIIEISGGIFGEKLIGVTSSSIAAFKLLEEFDHMKFYRENLIEDTDVTEGNHLKEIGTEDDSAYFSETIYIHGEEDTSGTIIKNIYQRELA